MADCIITYNGKEYKEDEFLLLLNDHLYKSGKEINLNKEDRDYGSIRIKETNGVDVREQTGDGETVGEGNVQREGPAGTVQEGAAQEIQQEQIEPEKGILFKDVVYETKDQLREALANNVITGTEYSQAARQLSQKNFDISKERLRQSLEGMFTKQAVGEPANLGEMYDSLVDFIKNAIELYGDRIRTAKDVAKYTGVKYNKTLEDAFNEATGKKVVSAEGKMRGFPKRIKEFEQFKDLKVDIENNPELRYDPQVLQEAKDRLQTMSDEEIIRMSNDQSLNTISEGQDNIATLAYFERINRARARGEDVMPIINEVSKKLTMWGQLIRQAAEMKGATAEGMLFAFEKMLENQQRFMTEPQRAKFMELSDKDIDARKALRDQQEKARIIPTEENVNEYDRLKREAENAYVDLAKYMQELTPRKFWDMMGMALQGNLLTPMSQMTNILANLMNIPITGTANTMASFIDRLDTLVRNSERTTTMDPRVAVYGMKGFIAGVKEAARQIRTGVPINEKAEIVRGFQPIRALQQAFAKKDKANIAVTKSGEVAMKDRVNKFIEGTIGMPAEVMFRLLNLGDKPFYRMGEAMTLFRIGKGMGLKGKALENFIKFPTKKAQDAAIKAAKEITFQEDSRTSKMAMSVASGIQNAFPGFGAWKFFIRTQMPYIKTPSNIISQTMDIAVPPWAIGKAIHAAYKGNKRESLIHAGKAGVGLMIGLAAKELLANGLMSASPDEEKKIRSLQYETMPPNSVNISGIGRLIKGEDPSYQKGDEIINYTKMGLVGMALGVHANVSEVEQELRKKKMDEATSDYATKIISSIIEIPSYALEMSFLQGTSTLITAMADKQWDYWLTNTFKAVASIPLPNTLDAANRASREYIPELKGDNLGERLSNVIRNKLFATENLPIQRNLWGEKILQTPEGSNGWMYQMFNVTKLQELQAKPESKLIYDLYIKTENPSVVPSVPTRRLTINSKPVELDSRQYERYLELVGQNRLKLLQDKINSGMFKGVTDEIKIDILEKTWNTGRDAGRMQLIDELNLK